MAAKAKKVAGYASAAERRAAVAWAMSELKRHSSARVRDEMGPRYGIVTKAPALGVQMNAMQKIAKTLGRDHDVAAMLWATGVYEGRMVACMVDEPARVTSAQMDAWAREFDNWGLCDTVCFKLFDQTLYVFAKVNKWAKSKNEFVKRGAFALLASAALHGVGEDSDYVKGLALIEAASKDERNFVKKGVNWALRAIGGKKSPKLRAAARDLAARLARSEDATQRWIGKDALRAFAKAGR